MKKNLIIAGLFFGVLLIAGCMSAREKQQPQPRKYVECVEWLNKK